MMHASTPEETLENHKVGWQILAPGMMFDNGSKGPFIVTEKNEDSIKVIPLTEENIQKIILGNPCDTISFTFEEIWIGNIIKPVNKDEILPITAFFKDGTFPEISNLIAKE